MMIYIIVTFFAGLLAGVFFFGTLHYSVGKMLASKNAWLWALGGFLIRMGVMMLVLFFAAGSDMFRWVAGLAGILVARTLVFWWTKQKEVRHAAES